MSEKDLIRSVTGKVCRKEFKMTYTSMKISQPQTLKSIERVVKICIKALHMDNKK